VDNDELARQWAIGLTGDLAAMAPLTSPAMRVWHSTDGEWLDATTAAQRMADASAGSTPVVGAFEEVRTMATSNGFVVQAVIDRGGVRTHIAQVLTVEDGVVVSVEEYIAPEETVG
jgi:ketosteroid isomerase-like protein